MLAEKYDAFVTSWDFPPPGALDLIRRVRESSEMAEIPVIVVSARNSEEDVRTAREAGANDYVLRPLTRDEFKERIERLVRSLAVAASPASAPAESES